MISFRNSQEPEYICPKAIYKSTRKDVGIIRQTNSMRQLLHTSSNGLEFQSRHS